MTIILQTVKIKRSGHLCSFSEFDFTVYELHMPKFSNAVDDKSICKQKEKFATQQTINLLRSFLLASH